MKKYKIENLECANCAKKLEDELNKLHNTHVTISFANNIAFIESDDLSKVKDCIKRLEPKVEIHPLEFETKQTSTIFDIKKYFNAELGILLTLIIIFLGSISIEHFYIKPLLDDGKNMEFAMVILKILWLGIYFIAGKDVFKGAWRSLKRKEFFDENFLMLSASIASFAINAEKEAVSIMLFFSMGEYLQNLTLKHSKESINSLSQFDLPNAHKIIDSNNQTIDISPDRLEEGDKILVYAGEMIPTDCRLLSDEATLDTSALSGESLPMGVKSRDEVLAGSIILGKIAYLEVLRPFSKSQIAKITELIQSAATQKSHTENFITTFARYYTPLVFLVALLVMIIPPLVLYYMNGIDLQTSFKDWTYRALVVLMVSCPCALVISVPIGYFGGIAACSKLGVLIKGSNYLEALSQLKLLAFDKTGTITKGVFKVSQIATQPNVSRAELLGNALCAQELSSHPIAQSIKNEFHKLSHKHNISEFEEISGLGVRAKCDNTEIIAGNDKILHKFQITHDKCDIEGSVVHIAVNRDYLGYIIIADELKDEAFSVIQSLKKLHIKPIILSGDGPYPCKIVGKKLGIDYYHSLLPQDKAKKFFELKNTLKLYKDSHRQKVGFVGDGINDAPTLALADVGISMGSGSDISRQNADIIILNNSLHSLLDAIKIARKTKVIIYENIAFALGVKALFIILGLFGIATIWEAVFSDVGVALLALANAMRSTKTIKNTQNLKNKEQI